MTTSELDVVAVPADDESRSYVDWPAIVGGVVLASAISVLMLTFGSAVGLSFTNFNARPDVSPVWLAIAAASWLLWVQVSSFMIGAYLTGRLRKRHGDSTEDESDVRDGAHGLLVWGGAVIVGAVLAAGGVGVAANTVGAAAATLTSAASNVAAGAADAIDPNTYYVDRLFRAAPAADTATAPNATAATEAAPAGTAETPASGATTPTSAATPVAEPVRPAATEASASPDSDIVRAEAGRIFAQAAQGEVPEADRTYLVQLVSDETGLSEQEAGARVDEVVAAIDTAKAEAAAVAESARKIAVLGAFLVAASLLVSAIGAYWAAQKGGNHRDEGTVLAGWFRRF